MYRIKFILIASIIYSLNTTIAAEMSAMQAMNQLNDRASYCSRNTRNNSEIIAINSLVFDALTNQQKRYTILLININLYYACLDAVNARSRFKNALIREGIDPTKKRYNIYLDDYSLPVEFKQFQSDYAEQIKAITESLKLPANYGSFDTLATIKKYAPMI